jgi:hypothetical protein|tara:strand:- start:582 stop:770 length:189 start_codon:yes stop_codon:yes gene_type:complete
MPKQDTSAALKTENNRLLERIRSLQSAIGQIRKEVGRITVSRDNANKLKENIRIIDTIIDRS